MVCVCFQGKNLYQHATSGFCVALVCPGKGYRSLSSWCITAVKKALLHANSPPSPTPTASLYLVKFLAKLKSSGKQRKQRWFISFERTKDETVVVKKEVLNAPTGMQSPGFVVGSVDPEKESFRIKSSLGFIESLSYNWKPQTKITIKSESSASSIMWTPLGSFLLYAT